MKTRGLQRSERGRQRGLDHRGVRTDKSPPVSGDMPTPSRRCASGAERSMSQDRRRPIAAVWGRTSRARSGCRARPAGRWGRAGAAGTSCCAGRGSPTARTRCGAGSPPWSRGRDSANRSAAGGGRRGRRRSRGHHDPQKLAHRLARELEKAFGGETSYTWSDRDGSLRATWSLPRLAKTRKARPPGSAGRRIRNA